MVWLVAVCAAGTITWAEPPPLDVRIDLGNYTAAGNWNFSAANATKSNLIDWNTGLQTVLGMSSSGWYGSASTDGWPAGVNLDWVAADAGDDYFYMMADFMGEKTATITLTGLTDGNPYRIQFVSSENYWGIAPADIKVNGNWADADYQGMYSSNIGDNWSGKTAFADRNWLIWNNVYSTGGSATISVTLSAGFDQYAAANAIRIEAIPEPATALMISAGGLLMVLVRRFYGRI